jgi:hypothetical protein
VLALSELRGERYDEAEKVLARALELWPDQTWKSSTFGTVHKLKAHAKYRFRARTAADAELLAGMSPVVYVDKMKVSLAVRLAGHMATFGGAVAPAHPGRAVTI